MLDAALDRCSAALMQDGRCLGVRSGGNARAAAAELPVFVQSLLEAHGPGDAVAVTVGPGSFTGLRGALALAHGLAIGAGAPVVGVTVAEAFLADAAPPGRTPWVALDTRRAGRVFFGDGAGMASVTLDTLPPLSGPVLILGNAGEAVASALRAGGADAVAGRAAVDLQAVGRVALRRLAGALPACGTQPLYVALPEARAVPPPRPAPA